MKKTLKCIRPDCGFTSDIEYDCRFEIARTCTQCGALMIPLESSASDPLGQESAVFLADNMPWPLALPFSRVVGPFPSGAKVSALASLARLVPRWALFSLTSEFLDRISGGKQPEGDVFESLLETFSGPLDGKTAGGDVVALIDKLLGWQSIGTAVLNDDLKDAWIVSLREKLLEFSNRLVSSAHDTLSSALPLAERLMAEMAFLTNYDLLYLSHVSDAPGPFTFRYIAFRGAGQDWAERPGRTDIRLPQNHVLIANVSEGALIDLHPFVILKRCPQCDMDSLFMWSRGHESGPEWLCVRSLVTTPQQPHRISEAALVKALNSRLKMPARFSYVFNPKYLVLEKQNRRKHFPLWREIEIADRYKLAALLTRGPNADIYTATDSVKQETVCLKCWPLGLLEERNQFKSWLLWSKCVVGLRDTRICPLLDFGVACGYAYHVLKLATGWRLRGLKGAVVSLDQISPPIPEDACAEVITQVAQGLGSLHDAGLVHGHIKPENVLLFEEQKEYRLCLADIGFSLSPWPFRASPLYMSPEQLGELTLTDRRTDMFAMGVMLYQMLTGRLPFAAPLAMHIAVLRAEANVQPPREIKPDISHEMEHLAMRLLAHDADQRPQTAQDVLDDLDKWRRARKQPIKPLRQLVQGLQYTDRHSKRSLVSLAETQRKLGASIAELDQLIMEGELTPVYLDGALLYLAGEVDAILAGRNAFLSRTKRRFDEIFQADEEKDALDTTLIAVEPEIRRDQGGFKKRSRPAVTDRLRPDSSDEIKPPADSGDFASDVEFQPGIENTMTIAEAGRELKLTPQQLDILAHEKYLMSTPIRGFDRYFLDSVLAIADRLDNVIASVRQRTKICMHVIAGEEKVGRRIVLDLWDMARVKRWIIGRAPSADIPLLEDDNVSRKHAAVRYPSPESRHPGSPHREAGQRKTAIQIRDLGSRNGTFVGSKKCVPGKWYEIELDTIFKIGMTEFRLEKHKG